MRKLSITSAATFVRTILPPHKRQSGRLQLLGGLLQPLRRLMTDYRIWRDTAITRARVTGETMSLEWYLNKLFDSTLQRIYIINAAADGLPIGIETYEELDIYWAAGLADVEPASFAAVPLEGEVAGMGSASFAVFVPVEYSALVNDIARIVRIYKIAGKSFVIKFF